MSEEDNSVESIHAYVVLKGPAGGVTSGAPISANNVREYTASPAVRKEVQAWLESLGFLVTHVSPLSISVEASPEHFESVFDGRLQRLGNSQPSSDFWVWFDPPQIPESMKDKVDTIIFPQPVRLAI